ncbi:MAG: hypothetical protein ATN36_00965, partial [Epulopiscium sp. Nele67-Bin005]
PENYYEIICIDDGSTDNSLNILKDFEKKHINLTVLTQKNQYAGVARNLGMTKAKGDYLLFIDADDFISDSIFEQAYIKFQEHNPDIILVDADLYDANKKEFQQVSWLLDTKYLPKKSVFSKIDIPDHIFYICIGAPWGKFFKRSLVNSKDIKFGPFRSSEDVVFVYPMLAVAQSIVVINRVLYHWRKGLDTNITSTLDLSKLAFLEAYDLLQQRLIELNVYQIVKKSFINRCMKSCMWNLSNYKSEELKTTGEKLFISSYADKFEITGKPQEYFYDKVTFNQYEAMLNKYKL